MTAGTFSSHYALDPPPAGFAEPEWTAPLDAAALLEAAPATATAKGMFLARLLKEVTSRGLKPPTNERFLAFHDYPIRVHMELHLEVARILYPSRPARDGLRRLGGLAHHAFAESHIGRIVLGVIGRDPKRLFGLVGRAMGHSDNVGTATTEVVDERTVMIRGENLYLFPDCFAVGVLESGLQTADRDGRVAVRMTRPNAPEYWVHWR